LLNHLTPTVAMGSYSSVRQLSRFVIFDISAHWASECPDVKNYKWRLNPVWHRMLYSCTHMATVGVKRLTFLIKQSGELKRFFISATGNFSTHVRDLIWVL